MTGFTLRSVKGSALTQAEMDANWSAAVSGVDLAASTGSALVGWIRSATGAIATTIATWLGWQPLNVKEFGAVGDGSTDDSAAFILAIAAASGRSLFINPPTSYYKLGSGLGTIPANTRLYGSNKRSAKIQRAFSGTQIATLADGVSFDELYFEGDGANFSGKGFVIGGTDGNQNVTNTRIINFNGNPVEFTATTAGSRSNWDNIEAWQTNGSTGSGKYAFVNADGSQLSAVPKSFHHIETSGFCSFDFGGSNDVFITDSFIGDVAYTANTRGVHIRSRMANQTTLTVNGANNTIVGSDVLAVITLASGATSCALGPNSWNTSPFVTDSSASNTNMVTHPVVTYTPTLTQSTSNPVLGDSTITGSYTREGGRITVSINFTVGTTIVWGTGNLQFSLPVTRVGSDDLKCGQVLAVNSGTPYTGIVEIPGAQAWCRMQRDATGVWTQASPVAWAAGATIRFEFSYSL